MLYDPMGDLSLSFLDRLIKIKYKNWKGEIGIRNIVPLFMRYGHTDFRKEDQWLLSAWDVDKDAERTYAIMDIIEFIKDGE